jgi:uncharacterized protein YgbK (DUF1537 family)
MPILRLLADDLTGALDTSVEFVGLCGPIEIGLGDDLAVDGKACLAIDSGTRERSAAEAVAVVERFAPLLKGADIAFKKVDSLFRGPWAAELAACFRLGYWRHCILAPAFPHHGRRTRDGRQFVRTQEGSWRDVSGDLAEALKAEGLPASLAPVGNGLADGVSIFDAETDADLDGIVALARQARGPVLWCGTGGLARALARGREVGASRILERPVLGLFGSDQPVTRAQLEACGSSWVEIREDGDVDAIKHRLDQTGTALVSVDLPAGLDRGDAAARIGKTLGSVAKALPAPGTVIVAGGETLRGLCSSLGAEALRVTGQVAPGLPRSVISGGHWDKVQVISKSGAFGGPDLWRDLLVENGLMVEGSKA